MEKSALDFIVIGAGNSGSTSLAEYLRTHPRLHLPRAKEKPFFSNERSYRRGWESYAMETFGGAGADRLWGKVTPQYMAGSIYEAQSRQAVPDAHRPERIVPDRIRRHFPDIKIVALLRDPVARCVSAHRMLVLMRKERRPLEQAVRQLMADESLATARRFPRDGNSYIVLGEYGRILSGYYATFPDEQMLTIFSSDLEQAPERTLSSVFSFLGVDAEFVPPNLHIRYREGTTRRRKAWLSPERMRRGLAARGPLRFAWRMLPAERRRRLESRFWDVAYQVELWNRVADVPAPRPEPEVMEALAEHYAADRPLLEVLIGKPVPWQR
jgi:Sulfotransferase family